MNKLLLLSLSAIATVAFACSSSDKAVQVVDAPDSGGGGIDAGKTGDDDDAGGGGAECTAAAKQAFKPVDAVSKGAVKVVSTKDGVTTIWIDATAGGTPNAAKNPRTYLTLDGKQVKISDTDAPTSSDWDLALKRAEIFTNSGDTGPGKGGAVAVAKAFDDVTADDADGLAQEKFFDADCEVKKDEGGFLLSTFLDWYDYDESTHIPKPKKDTAYVVKSASGALFKLGLLSYQGSDTGDVTGGETGQWLIQVKAL